MLSDQFESPIGCARPTWSSSSPPTSASIAICIVTYRRPERLTRLLETLRELDLPAFASVVLCVVDNDAEASACAVVDAFRSRFPMPVTYLVEARPGIAAARNAAVLWARTHTYVAFIDDDETPDPRWLVNLVSVAEGCAADVVGGPALPRFEAEVPTWLGSARLFDQPRWPTGTGVEVAATNNLLVRTSLLDSMGDLFDEDFSLSGGSDSHFSMRAHRAGHRIVWADEAVVYDWIPTERSRLSWVIRRAIREGDAETRCELGLAPGASARLLVRLRRAAMGLTRVAAGMVQVAWAGGRANRQAAARAIRRLSRGIGMLGGAAGVHVVEYRRADPEPSRRSLRDRVRSRLGALRTRARLTRSRLNAVRHALLVQALGGRYGRGGSVGPRLRWKHSPHAGIEIGTSVVVGSDVVLDVPPGGTLRIGTGVKLTGYTFIAAGLSIVIGPNTQVGEFCSIRDADHGTGPGELMRDQPMVNRRVVIEEDVWLGRGVAVLKGAHIERGAVIGANSVVAGHIPANAIAVGAPARVVRYRT